MLTLRAALSGVQRATRFCPACAGMTELCYLQDALSSRGMTRIYLRVFAVIRVICLQGCRQGAIAGRGSIAANPFSP